MAGYLDYLGVKEAPQESPEAEQMLSEEGADFLKTVLFGPKDVPLITGTPGYTEIPIPFTKAKIPVPFGLPGEAPIKGINLIKRAARLPKQLEKSASRGMKEYGEKALEGITKKHLRFDGMMDYGPKGKRALFTIEKPGHPLHGSTFSGPRIKKALRVDLGKGKKRIIHSRPGDTQHFQIYERLPADLQNRPIESGFMAGNDFISKGTILGPDIAGKAVLEMEKPFMPVLDKFKKELSRFKSIKQERNLTNVEKQYIKILARKAAKEKKYLSGKYLDKRVQEVIKTSTK